MSRTPSETCRNGHPMKDPNLIWHTRFDKKTKEKFFVRECRTCANDRYRAIRAANKRNKELLEQLAS